MRVKLFTIHTAIMAVLASLVLATPVNAASIAPLEIHAEPIALSLPEFLDDDLAPYALSPAKHKLTILHLWATWCIPCQEELPVLDRFAAKHKNVRIIALALNKRDIRRVRSFYYNHKIEHLPIYMDPKMMVFRSLKAAGLPTTIFIDNNGKEIARIAGPANWDSKIIDEFVEKNKKNVSQ